MIEIPLQLQFTPRPQRPTCARFIAGSDTASWLEELTTWNAPLHELRLYPLSKSRSDNSCLGVLVSHSNGTTTDPASGWQEMAGLQPLTQLYGRIAGRVYLPVEAALSVTLHDKDWNDLLPPGDAEYVWHPQAGLVAFESDEILTVRQLLSSQPPGAMAGESRVEWNCAQTGAVFLSHISSIRVDLPPTANEMLAAGRDGIGTQAKSLKDLPVPVAARLASWGQNFIGLCMLPFAWISRGFGAVSSLLQQIIPKSAFPNAGAGCAIPEWVFFVCLIAGLSSLIRNGTPALIPALIMFAVIAVLSLLVGALFGISTPAPGTAAPAGPGMFDGFGKAFQQRFAKLMKWSAGLLDARRREIERLKKLLDEDPDEGLKYALPIGGNAQGRIAEPTGWLSRRMVDFQLGGLGGSGLADPWELPPDTQFALITRYRQLAAREVQLGRYRRAAYIFAELLGDLNAAATTLVNGRFYREAAVLYRDKLNRPLDAARCLEQGGLLAEAIPLYRQQGMLETVGDLHVRLEETELAEQAYQSAVELVLSKQNHIEAARLYQDKLNSPDSALDTLVTGWRESSQSRLCLDATFVLLAKLGRHDDAVQRMRGLQQESLQPQQVSDVVEVLTTTATRSPHAMSRYAAADTSRILTSRALINQTGNRHQLTAAIGRLAPEDRLLARDCQRVILQTVAQFIPRVATGKRPLAAAMPELNAFKLPAGVTWTSATGTDRNFYAVGHKERQLIVAQGTWNDPRHVVTALSWEFAGDSADVFLCKSPDQQSLIMASRHAESFASQEFTANDANSKAQAISKPAWLPNSISAIAVGPGDAVYTFHHSELLLTGFRVSGQNVMSRTLDSRVLTHADADTTCLMVAYPLPLLAVGRHLIACPKGSAAQIYEMRDTVQGLTVSPTNTERRLAVLFAEGGEVIFGLLGSGARQRFGDGLINPRAVIMRGDQLIVHSKGCWEIYSTRGQELRLQTAPACNIQSDTFGLLRPGPAHQVALFTMDGYVRVYEVPE